MGAPPPVCTVSSRPLRWHDGPTLLLAQAACFGLALPAREGSFVLGPLVGAAIWGVIVARIRPELFRAVRAGEWAGSRFVRAPFHALVPAVAASALVAIAYAVGVAWSSVAWPPEGGAPTFTRSAGWLLFGALPLGALAVGLHFVASVVGLRAAFLATGSRSDAP